MSQKRLLTTMFAIFIGVFKRVTAAICHSIGIRLKDHHLNDSSRTETYSLFEAITQGRLDMFKHMVLSGSIKTDRMMNISVADQDLYIIWLVIFSGHLATLLYLVTEAHKIGVRKVDFTNSLLGEMAQHSTPEIKNYFNAMSILRGAGVNPEEVTGDIINAVLGSNFKNVISGGCINTDPLMKISAPDLDLFITWQVLYSGNLAILLYFVNESHKLGLPKFDFKKSSLDFTAQHSSPEIKNYYNAMSILQGADISPQEVTGDIINAAIGSNNKATQIA